MLPLFPINVLLLHLYALTFALEHGFLSMIVDI